MKKGTSTTALIKVFSKSSLKKFSLSLPEIHKYQGFKYILIIKSFTDKSMRITLYPLVNRDVLKLIVKDSNHINGFFYELSEFLKHYEVIHTSGLIELKNEYIFECYCKLDLDSPELYDLKNFINNIKKSSTFFNIEKIKFKR